MKKTLFFATLAALAMSMALSAQVITVTSPTASDEWCIGSSHTITWTKSGDMANVVTVRLRRSSSGAGDAENVVIESRTDNDGEVRWTIPDTVEPGEYSVRVRTLEDEPIVGNSPDFTIKTCSDTPAPRTGASISVTSPDADDEWCVGSTHTIRWRSIGKTPTTIDIRLRRADSTAADAAVESIATDHRDLGILGSYSWTIPASVPAGEYFIRLRSGDLSADSPNFTIAACPCDLELKSISYTFGHGGQIVARVANHVSPIDRDVRFYLVFPEMIRDGAQFVTRRLTLAAGAEENVYLWALPQNNIPLKGLQVQANIDGPTSQIPETNEDNNRQETRIAILDLSCRAPRDDLELHRIYANIHDDFRVEFKVRVRHNLAREMRNIRCHWALIGPDGGELTTYHHAIESLPPGEEHIWRVNETYGEEGKSGSKRPRLREGATYRIRAYLSDPGDAYYDVNPGNDSYTISFRFPD